MSSLNDIEPDVEESFHCAPRGNLSGVYPIGQSAESRAVEKSEQFAYTHFLSPNRVSEIIKNPAQRFYSLKARWQSEIRFLSDTNEICTHEAYQKIVGMGEKALPFIYFELKNDPDNWFWALKAITDEDPVPESDRGNLEKMTALWGEWIENHFAAAWFNTGTCQVVIPTRSNWSDLLIWSYDVSSRSGVVKDRI